MVQFSVVTNMVVTFSVITTGSSASQTLPTEFSKTTTLQILAKQLPTAVAQQKNRPQPRFDRTEGDGMAVVVGRVRKDPVFDGVKYVALGHNTIRGAAGCAILIAESMRSQGYL